MNEINQIRDRNRKKRGWGGGGGGGVKKRVF